MLSTLRETTQKRKAAAVTSISQEKLAELTQKARKTIQNSTAQGTRKGYKGKVKQVSDFVKLITNRDILNENGDLIDKPTVDEFTAFLEAKREEKSDITSGALKGFRSAMNKFIKDNKLASWDSDEEYLLSQYFMGTVKENAQEIRDGIRKAEVGKEHLTVEELLSICKATLDNEHYSLGRHQAELHCFVCLSHAMMSRLETTSATHITHLDWEEDSLLIGVAKSKKNYSEVAEWYHVYANPFKPEVCCVLALALLLASDKTIIGMCLNSLSQSFFQSF
jgi:hypothetical protein